jgi:hypothetical protein
MFKIIYIFLLGFFSFQVLSSELVEASKPELENFQDTAFIKIMNTFNGGKIPYPFSNLLDSFGIGVREKSNILFIPKGRSLVKDFADYQNPRIIVEPFQKISDAGEPYDPTGGPEEWKKNRAIIEKMNIRPGDLFIGFAPNHKALEVISYNQKNGQYDFFIVENYDKGQTPKIVSSPASCITCHQNKAPIFARFPWSEALGDSGAEYMRSFGFATFGQCSSHDKDLKNDIMEKIIAANPNRAEIEGIKLNDHNRYKFCKAAAFDSTVRTANTKLLKNKACEILCPTGSEDCKMKALKTLLGALRPKEFDRFDEFKKINDNILSSFENFKSSALPNRDPYTNTAFKSLLQKDQVVWTNEKLHRQNNNTSLYDETYDDPNTETTGFGEMDHPTKDMDFMNPTTERPTRSDVQYMKYLFPTLSREDKVKFLAEKCMADNELSIIKQTLKKQIKEEPNGIHIDPPDLSLEEKNAILESPTVKAELKKQSPNGKSLFNAFAREAKLKFALLEEPATQLDCVLRKPTDAMPVYVFKQINDVVDKFEQNELERPKQFFAKYCVECHGGDFPFIRLPLNSVEEMANYVPTFSNKGVQERLEKNIMPPKFAIQPSAEERSWIIKIIKDLKKP